jgi:hypothetical protein
MSGDWLADPLPNAHPSIEEARRKFRSQMATDEL